MNARAVSLVIRHALRRCGIEVPRPGSHLLRHTLASHLVQNGASLKEVADLLRAIRQEKRAENVRNVNG